MFSEELFKVLTFKIFIQQFKMFANNFKWISMQKRIFTAEKCCASILPVVTKRSITFNNFKNLERVGDEKSRINLVNTGRR